MSNSYFQFKQFTIHQDRCAMKVTTDACLFGAWVAEKVKMQNEKFKDCLDIGTGTGFLSLMLAQKKPDINIDAIEIDEEATQQAKENINSSPFADRIFAIHADAKKFHPEKKYDLIISNPPFYENELRSETTSKNIAHHGDELTISELFIIIGNNLTEDGSFFLLLPYKRYNEIMQILNDSGLALSDIIFVRQSTKHEFFRVMLQGKLKNKMHGEIEVNEISIWNDHQQYTDEFIELLKDYYLYL